ncbi:hypothetical protein CEK25_001970 [Fusarium fujikuroi]|nr:hypothetical protein CEK25_001970 [Fusarium fujikuroi]
MAFNNTAQSRDFKGISFWHSLPLAHWRFVRAERGKSISSDDVIDTGDLYRATIPFYEADDRASLEFYRGPAMVTNSRTACVGPTFQSFKIDYYPVSDLSSPELILRAEFQAYIDKLFDMREEKYLPMTAECKLINDWDSGSSEWPLTMCRIIPQVSPYQKIYDFYPRLLVNSKGPLNIPLHMRDESRTPFDEEQSYEEYLEDYLAPFAKLKAKKNGPWTKVFNDDGDEVLEATAVSTESGYGESADKVLPGRLQQTDGSYGPNRSSDVGDLHLYDYWDPTKYAAEEHEHGVRYDPYGFADVLDSIELSGWTLRLSGVGDHTPRLPRTWFIHPDHTDFFQEPNYDIIEQANTVNAVAIQLPRRWTRLIIVLLIIFVHFITLTITVISFALHTESSMLGEPWQAVSQVLSPETERLIQEGAKGASMADRHVKEWAKATGRNVGFYSVIQHHEDQEAKIQKRETSGKPLTATMRSVVFKGVKQVALEDRPKPTIQDPTDIIAKVKYTALCGSELHVFRGHQPSGTGFIMGHEFTGVVDEVGSAITKLQPGDAIVSPFTVSCGECFFCKHGFSSRCDKSLLFGTVPLDGAQAEYVRIPYAESTVVKAPEEIDDLKLCLMADIFPTGCYAASNGLKDLSKEQVEDSIVVLIGCGPVGICALIAALEYKPKAILAVDGIESRLSLAKSLGAEPWNYLTQKDELEKRVKELSDGRGADVIIEVVGHSSALDMGFKLLRPWGIISSVGVHNGEIPWTGNQAYGKNLTIKMGRCPVRSIFEDSLKLLAKKQHLLDFMTATVMPLSNALEGYELFDSMKAQKVIFDAEK